MPIHNHAFSTAVLAKTMLGALDESKPETVVATATLKLLLCSIVDAQMGGHAVQDAASKAVSERISAFEGVMRAAR